MTTGSSLIVLSGMISVAEPMWADARRQLDAVAQHGVEIFFDGKAVGLIRPGDHQVRPAMPRGERHCVQRGFPGWRTTRS